MSVLLIHSEDELDDPRWSAQAWSRVIDLGRAGSLTYDRLSGSLHCSVEPIDPMAKSAQKFQRVRRLLEAGSGHLIDRYGLDWWELAAILLHEQIASLAVLREFVEYLPPREKVYVSRHGFHAEVLRLLIGDRLHVLTMPSQAKRRGVSHYLRLLRRFPPAQLLEILGDKLDPGYQLRGRLARRKHSCSSGVVLLPSAYGNVSRTVTSYARSAPGMRFLLIATRRSAWTDDSSSNLTRNFLKNYASVADPARDREYSRLSQQWEAISRELLKVPEFKVLASLGHFSDFPQRIGRGLEVRDAWRNVFDREPVEAVLCGDDSNPYTHIPLLLAVRRGLPALACHHGALDGHHLFKQTHADVILAKGKMEEDYLVARCGRSPEKVTVAAPALSSHQRNIPSGANGKRFIVLFSEPYEVTGGRAIECYRDVVPRLANLAKTAGRQLIIKLHPMESLSARKQLLDRSLSKEQKKITRLQAGSLKTELLAQTWFAITVSSSVAVECLLLDVPCFLCRWLDFSAYGYPDQFLRFQVALGLEHPNEMEKIPRMLEGFTVAAGAKENCWSAASEHQLENLFRGERGAARELAGSSVA